MSPLQSARARGPAPRMCLWALTLGATVTAAALAGAPLDARVRARASTEEMQTEALAPVHPDDRGSILTRGVGIEPRLAESERRILEAARAAVDETRARTLGSTSIDPDRLSPMEIECLKLDRLARQTPAASETGVTFPDATRKGE